MRRYGLTLIELLVVLGIMSLLMAITIPAIQRIREAANRLQCASNMRQIGLACHHYHADRGRLPYSQLGNEFAGAGASNPLWGANSQSWSWLAKLLPYVEQQSIFNIGDIPNKTLRMSGVAAARIPLFLCPSDLAYHAPPLKDAGNLPDFPVGLANYKGVSGSNWGYDSTQDLWFQTPFKHQGVNGSYDGKMEGDGILCRNDHLRKPRLDQIYDGQSNTFMIGEDIPSKNRWVSWPYANNAHGTCAIPPNLDYPDPQVWYYTWSFRSRHPGGLQFCMADGSVHFIRSTISLDLYRALSTRHGGETVQIDD